MSIEATSNWIDLRNLEAMQWLPERVRINELKQYGMVSFSHTKPRKTKPWIPPGWYKFIGHDGKVYIVEISSALRGIGPYGWLYRPAIRCRARLRRAA